MCGNGNRVVSCMTSSVYHRIIVLLLSKLKHCGDFLIVLSITRYIIKKTKSPFVQWVNIGYSMFPIKCLSGDVLNGWRIHLSCLCVKKRGSSIKNLKYESYRSWLDFETTMIPVSFSTVVPLPFQFFFFFLIVLFFFDLIITTITLYRLT